MCHRYLKAAAKGENLRSSGKLSKNGQRDNRGYVNLTVAGLLGLLMARSPALAESKFLSQ